MIDSLGGGVQWRSNEVGSVVIFDFRNVGAEAGSENHDNAMKTKRSKVVLLCFK